MFGSGSSNCCATLVNKKIAQRSWWLSASQPLAESLDIPDLSDVILSRKRLPYLDELCETKGVVGEPVIFQTAEDKDKKKASILGDGSGDIEKALYWILGDSS